jgi:poly(3-hydroxybutyrate) depolymerase
MKQTLLLLALLAIFPTRSNAQKTGSFTDTVLFNSKERILSCYVPPAYDSSIRCQLMVCLHGMGDNSNNYRNALISSLNWKTVFPGTIFICPSGGDDANGDFSTPPGDEEIIEKSIAYAKQHYNIDSTKIILQGFSLGGRSALKYGLDNPAMFKGLLLNTPAIQGLDDALNKIPFMGMYFNYANASKVPAYITCGGSDLIYMITIPPMLEQLKLNNARVKLVTVPGMDHTIPGSAITGPCIPFFDNPATAPYDLDLFKIAMEDRSCDTTVVPKIYVRNVGGNAITSFDLNYRLNGNSGTHTWTGSIGSYEHTVVTMPQLAAFCGLEDSIVVSIGAINGSINDTATANNQMTKFFSVETNGTPYPVFQGFEGNTSDGWIFPETGSIFAWYRDTDVHKTGTASLANFNTILMFYSNGDVESFLSPVMDLASVAHPKITFDYAFNYHKYTPPYFNSDTVFGDTLEVSISLDCGATFQTLFKKGGADLATTPSPIINPLTLTDCFFSPAANEWKTEIIDLQQFATERNAIIRFSDISNMGGNIYVDNIQFATETAVENVNREMTLRLYPNPAKERVSISYTKPGRAQMLIYDMLGKCVIVGELNSGTNDINVSALSKGIYMIQIHGNNWTEQRKLTRQ